MKKLVITLLSLVIILVNAQFGLQIAVYEIFKPSIIEEFCINKDNPDSDCEAMCHMSKKAREDSKHANKKSSLETEIQIKLTACDHSIPVVATFSNFGIELPVVFGRYTSPLLNNPPSQVFSPPKA